MDEKRLIEGQFINLRF